MFRLNFNQYNAAKKADRLLYLLLEGEAELKASNFNKSYVLDAFYDLCVAKNTAKINELLQHGFVMESLKKDGFTLPAYLAYKGQHSALVWLLTHFYNVLLHPTEQEMHERVYGWQQKANLLIGDDYPYRAAVAGYVLGGYFSDAETMQQTLKAIKSKGIRKKIALEAEDLTELTWLNRWPNTSPFKLFAMATSCVAAAGMMMSVVARM